MKDSGCCGASEFVKLWAYTLTQYHRVVHLDMDTVLYRNIVSQFTLCVYGLNNLVLSSVSFLCQISLLQC